MSKLLLATLANQVNNEQLTFTIYSDGDSVTAYPNNYTLDFSSYVAANVPYTNVITTDVAVSGQSQAQMLSTQQANILSHHPDIITLCTYLNDTAQYNDGTYSSNVHAYVDNALSLVNDHTGLPPQLILMTDNLSGQNLSQPYARPYATQVAVHNELMSIYETYADNPNVQIADVFALFDALGGSGNPDTPALYAVLLSDMVHPNVAGYAMFSNLVNPMIANACQRIREFYRN